MIVKSDVLYLIPFLQSTRRQIFAGTLSAMLSMIPSTTIVPDKLPQSWINVDKS
jgi:hypothetical protein